MYTSEQIKFEPVAYIDNQPVLDLIESKPHGILRMLDEELRFPKSNDETFVERLHREHSRTKLYSEVRKTKFNFIVKHYAGDVEYESIGFMEVMCRKLPILLR